MFANEMLAILSLALPAIDWLNPIVDCSSREACEVAKIAKIIENSLQAITTFQ
jgi:hypothetical protein